MRIFQEQKPSNNGMITNASCHSEQDKLQHESLILAQVNAGGVPNTCKSNGDAFEEASVELKVSLVADG